MEPGALPDLRDVEQKLGRKVPESLARPLRGEELPGRPAAAAPGPRRRRAAALARLETKLQLLRQEMVSSRAQPSAPPPPARQHRDGAALPLPAGHRGKGLLPALRAAAALPSPVWPGGSERPAAAGRARPLVRASERATCRLLGALPRGGAVRQGLVVGFCSCQLVRSTESWSTSERNKALYRCCNCIFCTAPVACSWLTRKDTQDLLGLEIRPGIQGPDCWTSVVRDLISSRQTADHEE